MACMPLCWSLDLKEDHSIDWEVNSFDIFLSISDLDGLKQHLLQDYRLGKDEFHLCKPGSVHLCFPQVYHYLTFVNWFALKYYENRKGVLSNYDSRVLCKINLGLIKKILKVPMSESQNYILLNEENLMTTYCQFNPKSRVNFLSKFIK